MVTDCVSLVIGGILQSGTIQLSVALSLSLLTQQLSKAVTASQQ